MKNILNAFWKTIVILGLFFAFIYGVVQGLNYLMPHPDPVKVFIIMGVTSFIVGFIILLRHERNK